MSGNKSRVQAIYEITNRKPMTVNSPQSLDKIWACDVFNIAKMEDALSKNAFKAVKKTVQTGTPLDKATADIVAAAMKEWAISKGVKFFSHIFYPMTNVTAEKHDGFIITNSDGRAITEFTGSLLIKGEPDGSSFPNGSIRMTNAARGYTAWDPTSPAYIMHTDNGATLMIPSVFMSWTGEALDKKIPLLRSNDAMNKAAQKVLSLMGETKIAPLNSSCGAEQEYFLVDANFANARPDLLLAGRTLFGAAPAKGQEFDDHYFGAIPERVQVFMQDFEDKLYRLGIPAKTHHNEVAPGQFEIAPYFEAANVASDHQQLLMALLKSTAKAHGFLCLLHEKPFAGINGSGKHVNWSVGNSTQGNLLDPGSTPHDNLNFLLFCGAVIRGVHQFGPLLRAAIASSGNDHRLCANEAPPAILSVYLGDQLEKVFMDIKEGNLTKSQEGGVMDLGLSQILNFKRDPGDRNRTSPFAFTGNRFEFRAVGSAQSVSGPLITMNTMLADSLEWIAAKLGAELDKGVDQAEAVINVLKELINEHGNVVFGGDGYSSDWHLMAIEERGLKNIPTTADALPVLRDESVKALFKNTGVLSPVELESRYEVYSEQYILSIEVEAKLVIDIAKTKIYPAAINYFSNLAEACSKMTEMNVEPDNSITKTIADEATAMISAVKKLSEAMKKHDFSSTDEHMQYCANDIRGLMDEVRSHADALEVEVADEQWPLAKYHEMLFIK
ncbi:MAG: glutamine synthetase III [gamma proteobacterium symbiont of Bathyaustriella thionipta]|nr:glutamine synthetase III [gamma proteobacterium symbiont of Bathyaustriella thionipta]MCU7950489.1 glutamine synthetase III [gamma proteobacterium symbiont of Bathyaustriella thionipta]MCU7954929.1 glutamine synthetase III [gamma proteobacterium symbiont of Bathyaustriella thionipta]MCU7957818.1 glutamine synthetase III [gamma proteobacterium symbiont of Bathyaustriella thionipta]MCU7968176.1 glutamine synthetase III [gamma proteobacterium symbiont of Bathyaustriella thionipta]